MRRWTIGTVALLAAVLLMLAGCGSGDSSSSSATSDTGEDGKEPVDIAFVGPLANEPISRVLEGMKAFAAENGATVEGLDSGFDAQKQLRVVQDAVTTGRYGAIVLTPFDQTGGNLAAAKNAGVPIVTLFTTIGPEVDSTRIQVPFVTAQIYESYGDMGVHMAEAVVEGCADADPCKVGYMSGAGLGAEVEAFDRMRNVWSRHPNIEVVETKPGNYDQGTALRLATDMLQAHPDLDFFASMGDQMSFGIAQAAANAGVADRLKILGVGGSARAIEAIRDGRIWGTTLHNSLPFTQGEQVAEMALQAARRERIPDAELIPEYGGVPFVLTEDNQDEWRSFRAQWRG